MPLTTGPELDKCASGRGNGPLTFYRGIGRVARCAFTLQRYALARWVPVREQGSVAARRRMRCNREPDGVRCHPVSLLPREENVQERTQDDHHTCTG
jgi:hypothetical protein